LQSRHSEGKENQEPSQSTKNGMKIAKLEWREKKKVVPPTPAKTWRMKIKAEASYRG
jgi:hypothetical protein